LAHPRKTSKLQFVRNTRSSGGPSTIRSSFGLLPWACAAHNPTKGLPCAAHKATQGCHAQPTKVWACHAQPNPLLGCARCSYLVPVASFCFVSSNLQDLNILRQYIYNKYCSINFFFFFIHCSIFTNQKLHILKINKKKLQ
jgi:hypothetical protein